IQLPEGGAPVRGGATIAAGFDDAPGLVLDWTPREGGVSAAGDLGWTWGRYTATWPEEDEASPASTGKYLNVWIREEGEWRVLVDMGNSDVLEE
ncbi:nuclear transport factor 2 family protein, partial [bacterium]|nr:nuclear transport factor 2 family protein [bacterium]MBU1677195.1 nuclear transport factor 2 family protein [bacterium]